MKSFQKGKLVLSYKIVFSMDTEFIENENENVSKQNCEIAAARRLLKRLAKKKPPICLATAMRRNKADHKNTSSRLLESFRRQPDLHSV